MGERQRMGLLFVSHGACCEGMLDTVGMLAGEQTDIDALALNLGADPDVYQKQIEAWLDHYGDNAVILVDIMGGTPFNTIMRIAQKRPIHAVTGLSVAMAIEAAVSRAFMSPSELCSHLVQCVPDSIKNVEALFAQLGNDADDDEEDE